MKEKIVDTILPLITVAAVILISVVIGSNLGNRDSPPGADSTVQTVMNEQPVDILTDTASMSESISIPGFERATMKAKQLHQEISFYNPKQNNCYFQISILLSEGIEIYRSGLLKPGDKLNQIKLTRTLEPGTYKGTILRYSCYSMEDLQPLNGADANFTLEVEP